MQKKKIKKLGKKKGITISDLAVTVNDLTVTVNDLTATVNDLAMTVEELARMTQRGFENTATKADITRIDVRLDHIENLLIRAHENRIEILEDKMRQVQTTLGK